MTIKDIREKGFDFFCSNGRMPSRIIISNETYFKLVNNLDAYYVIKYLNGTTEIDGLEVTIDDSIEGIEVK